MLLSLFSSIALADLAITGSIPHVARQQSGTVTCTPVSGATGALVMTSSQGAPITLPFGGVTIITTSSGFPLVLQENLINQQQEFTFVSCSSTYMGWITTPDGSHTAYYG
jgi:hypothetical protein